MIKTKQHPFAHLIPNDVSPMDDDDILVETFADCKITTEMLRLGHEIGIVRFVPECEDGKGIKCRISFSEIDYNEFFFGSPAAEEVTPEEYLRNVGINNVLQEVAFVLDEFQHDVNFINEWAFYYTTLCEMELPEEYSYNCTDPDCAQYGVKISDKEYGYIEVRSFPGKYVVCHASVNLHDYSEDVIEDYCRGYYESLSEIKECYGTSANQIMAECVFEQLPLAEMDFVMDSFDNAEDAFKYVVDYVATHNF